MPFKTQFTPDFKLEMNGVWGKTYPKAGYPEREKKEVQLFDIREFVKKKKQEKMESMMSGEGGMSSPFGGGNPFGGGRSPFGGANPFGGPSNPFGPSKDSMPSLNSLLGNDQPTIGGNDTFNVDELVKKIDAKIAELEEEERKEQEAAKENDRNKVIEAELDNEEDTKLYEAGTFGDDFFNDFFNDEV